MHYVGLDAHLRQSTFCVLDDQGRKVLTRTVRGSSSEVVKELAKIREPFAVCFEASSGYGVLHERLRPLAQRVVVANPGQLRLIFRSKRKNDRVDAEKLAKLLYLGETPSIHVVLPENPIGSVASGEAEGTASLGGRSRRFEVGSPTEI